MPRTAPPNQTDVLLALLREARQSAGVTQTALAEFLGFRQTDISKVERGDRRLDILELRAWVDGLGVPFLDFVEELHRRLAAQEVLHTQASGAKAVRNRPKA